MVNQGRLVLVVGSVIGAFFACAQPTYIDGRCETDLDCHTVMNPQADGSVCRPSGRCGCPFGTRECCPKGSPLDQECFPVCLVASECASPVDSASEGGGECLTDSECPGPPDAVCGSGVCVSGTCELAIQKGPLASQRYGDCKRRECNEVGAVVEVDDDSDYYDDGNVCTFDSCKGGPSTLVLPDGVACPGGGYCYQGRCVECIAAISSATCGFDLYCDYISCIPVGQCGAQCGGLCEPCGVGHACSANADCETKHCSAGMCQLPICGDGEKNGVETGVDCGEDSCALCPAGEGCKVHEDCLSQVCKMGTCQAPTCVDAVQNGTETGVDCGTELCGPCGSGN